MRSFARLSPATADRAAQLSCRVLAGLNILFLLAFLLALGITAARAEASVCAGTDLVAALAKEEPAKVATAKAEAERQPNGRGVLWRIEGNGREPSFLFGTMHSTDPRVLDLSDAVWKAFDGAGTVAIETTDMLDQTKIAAITLSDPSLTMFTDETTLFSLVSPADRVVLEEGLRKLGIPPFSVSKMKPWLLATLVSMPPCERSRQTSGGRMLDLMLADEAKMAAKQVVGLETGADQIRAITSLPMEYHIGSLVETLRMGDRAQDIFETMIVMYENGDLALFSPALKALFPGPLGDLNGFGFQEILIDKRNEGMASAAVPLIEKGGAFIAVGALHLPGEKGLVALLRQRGFTVVEGE